MVYEYDNNKRLIAIIVITLSGFHCTYIFSWTGKIDLCPDIFHLVPAKLI